MEMSAEQMDHIFKTLDEIKLAIKGDESIGHDGLVKRVKRHEERIMAIERYFVMFFAVASFFGTSLTIFAYTVYPLLKDIMHH